MCTCELLVQVRSLPCRPGRSEDGIRKITFLSHPSLPYIPLSASLLLPRTLFVSSQASLQFKYKDGAHFIKRKRLLFKLRFQCAMKGDGEFFVWPNKCSREAAECIKMLQMPCNSFISAFFTFYIFY